MGKCDYIIGSYANPLDTIEPNDLNTSMAVMERAFKIGMASRSEQKFKYCDLLIAPPKLNQIGTFSIGKIDEVFDIGCQAAVQTLKKTEMLSA